MPFGGTLSDLITKVFGLEFVSQLRLGGNVGFELFYEFTRIIGKIVEAFLLEVAEARKR